jgi:hypothetical protein
MSSDAARAMFPALAKAEDQRRQVEVRSKSGGSSVTLPSWATSTDPMWRAQPAPPRNYDCVPTLRRISKR